MEQIVIGTENEFHWLDIVDPTREELEAVAAQYGLHPTSVQDCLDPEHLPKYERIGNVTFLITRAYDQHCIAEADSIQELTRKIAIFKSENFLITVHRKDQPFVAKLREKWAAASSKNASGPAILSDVLAGVIGSYEKPIDTAFAQLEAMEIKLFKESVPSILEDGYYLKRTASVFKRMLRMQLDIVPKLNTQNENLAPVFQNVKDEGDAMYFYADDLLENVNSLMNLHLSMDSARTNEASHRTNEVVRVLTVFSVFFMPLNLIAGIYGMNFEIIPGAHGPYGFFVVLGSMVMTTLGIYLWMWKRGWLR